MGIHSFFHNTMSELSQIRGALDSNDSKQQEMADTLRRELNKERADTRESINKFRYDFDELVHARVESVLEGLEEMNQNQQRKDRLQQQQLDTVDADMKKIKVNLMHVNNQWGRYKDNSFRRHAHDAQ